MNNDLISREALKKHITEIFEVEEKIDKKWAMGLKYSLKIIDNAPTVDLKDIYQEGHYDGHLEGYTKAINEERPQGEWIIDVEDGINTMVTCPFCKERHCCKMNFCGNCGADMRKGGVE